MTQYIRMPIENRKKEFFNPWNKNGGKNED